MITGMTEWRGAVPSLRFRSALPAAGFLLLAGGLVWGLVHLP